MTEIRTPFLTDTYIYSAAQWNEMFRALPREVQNALGWMFFNAADAGSGVVGGYAASEGAALRSDVTRGLAIVYDGTVSAPASKWKWGYSGATLQATHAAHHASNARIDLLSLTFASDTDTPEVTGRVGDVASSIDTQRGCATTLTITKGVEDGTLAVPSTPAGALAIWRVYVPATSGALEYLDRRAFVPGPLNRPKDAPVAIQALSTDGEANLFDITARKAAHGATGYTSSLNVDMTNDWPFFTRAKGGSGEDTGAFYPMMIPISRVWHETTSIFWGSAGYTVGDTGDIIANLDIGPPPGLQVEHVAGTDACTFALFIPLQCQDRSLEVVSAHLDYAMSEAFTGSTTFITALVYRDGPSGLALAATFDMLTPGVVARNVATMTPTARTLATDDRLFLEIIVSRSGSGITNAGRMAIYALTLGFKEGRG